MINNGRPQRGKQRIAHPIGKENHDWAPTNAEAEKGLLASLFALPEAADYPEVSALLPGDFFALEHRVIFRHLVGMRLAGQSPETLPTRLHGSGEWNMPGVKQAVVDAMKAGVSGSDARWFADQVRETAQRRKWWEVSRDIAQQVRDGLPPDDIAGFVSGFLSCTGATSTPATVPTFREMNRDYPTLRPAIITGLLREGETANLIAATKVGKSWLALSLALCVITGKRWLGTFSTKPGRVLIIDNELHRETITHRIRTVAAALEIMDDEFADRLHVEALRGKLRDVNGLGELLLKFEPGYFNLIIVDAFYRCLPRGTDENKNADVAAIYNTIDSYADRLRCAFASVHHATKGTQAGKATTDIGSGAGSFSRAADCHFVLRPHAQKDVAIVEAALRSWPPLEPLALRWAFPLWMPDESIDPAEAPARASHGGGVGCDPDRPTKFQVTMEKIQAALIKHGPQTKNRLKELTKASGKTINEALEALFEFGRVREVQIEMHNGPQTAFSLTDGYHQDGEPDSEPGQLSGFLLSDPDKGDPDRLT